MTTCCITCQKTELGDMWPLKRTLVVCPDCGNKRCPRATHHDNDCTGSNEYGQPGSYYSEDFEWPSESQSK